MCFRLVDRLLLAVMADSAGGVVLHPRNHRLGQCDGLEA